MKTEIIYPSEKYFKSFHETLDIVAKEHLYLEMFEAPSLEKVSGFQSSLIEMNGPICYAVHNDRVVGWCDVFPESNPRHCHRGNLGMGLIPEFRGLGLGSQLLSFVIDHAKKIGLEKIELQVYTSNVAAIALYKKFGFEQEGVIKNSRKVDGQYLDSLLMAKFLR